MEPSPSRLIIVGASARAAAISAVAAGYRPYSIDLFADRDLRRLGPAVQIADFRNGLPQALAEAPNAAWLYTGGLENYPRLVDRLAAIRPLLGNRGDVLRRVRDPWQLQAVLRQHGFAMPEISQFPPRDSSKHAWLAKPQRSAGGRGIDLWRADKSEPPDGDWYCQQFVKGQPASAAFLAAAGQARLLGASEQLVGESWNAGQPFGYAGSLVPLMDHDRLVPELQRLGNVLAAEFGLAGLFGVDFVCNEDGIWVLEVNPRYTASMELLEQGRPKSLVAQHVAACSDSFLPPDHTSVLTRTARSRGKLVVFAEQDASTTPATEQLIQRWRRSPDWPRIADLPAEGISFRRGEPVVTVYAAAANRKSVIERLRQRRQQVLQTLRPVD